MMLLTNVLICLGWADNILEQFIIKNYVFLPQQYRNKFRNVESTDIHTPNHWTLNEHMVRQSKQTHEILQLTMQHLQETKKLHNKVDELHTIILQMQRDNDGDSNKRR